MAASKKKNKKEDTAAPAIPLGPMHGPTRTTYAEIKIKQQKKAAKEAAARPAEPQPGKMYGPTRVHLEEALRMGRRKQEKMTTKINLQNRPTKNGVSRAEDAALPPRVFKPGALPVQIDPSKRRETAIAMGRPEIPQVGSVRMTVQKEDGSGTYDTSVGPYQGYKFPVTPKEHTDRAAAIGELMLRQHEAAGWAGLRAQPGQATGENETFVQYETSPRQMQERNIPVGRPQRAVKVVGEMPQATTTRDTYNGPPNRIKTFGPTPVNPAYDPKFDRWQKTGGPVETRVDPSIKVPPMLGPGRNEYIAVKKGMAAAEIADLLAVGADVKASRKSKKK